MPGHRAALVISRLHRDIVRVRCAWSWLASSAIWCRCPPLQRPRGGGPHHPPPPPPLRAKLPPPQHLCPTPRGGTASGGHFFSSLSASNRGGGLAVWSFLRSGSELIAVAPSLPPVLEKEGEKGYALSPLLPGPCGRRVLSESSLDLPERTYSRPASIPEPRFRTRLSSRSGDRHEQVPVRRP